MKANLESFLNTVMSAYGEKVYFGLGSMVTAATSVLAAVFSPTDSRWVFVTLSCSIMTALSLTLSFKKPDETIKVVVGKAMISILSGIFLTKLAVYFFGLSTVHTDLIALGGVACACCSFGFFLLWAGLRYLMKRSDAIAKQYIDGKIGEVLPKEEKE